MSLSMRFNFAWGDSVCVREALLNHYRPKFFLHDTKDLLDMGYPDTEGNSELLKYTKSLAEREYDSHFPYIAISAGAHHGMATILRAFRDEFKQVRIGPTHFSFYPRLIEKERFPIKIDPNLLGNNTLNILDSPSNPEGNLSQGNIFCQDSTLWDGVYNNGIFSKIPTINPGKVSRFFIGSYSKFLGLNGTRLGWIGCKTKEDYDKILKEIVDDTLGISMPSQLLALDVLKNTNIDLFIDLAANKIDNNRTEMSRLEKFFGPIPVNGMFYLGKLDNHLIKLLKKADVNYIKGEECGAPGFARFNLAQNNELTKEMVDTIIKIDRIK